MKSAGAREWRAAAHVDWVCTRTAPIWEVCPVVMSTIRTVLSVLPAKNLLPSAAHVQHSAGCSNAIACRGATSCWFTCHSLTCASVSGATQRRSVSASSTQLRGCVEHAAEGCVENAAEGCAENEAEGCVEHAAEGCVEHAAEGCVEHAAEGCVEHAAGGRMGRRTDPSHDDAVK